MAMHGMRKKASPSPSPSPAAAVVMALVLSSAVAAVCGQPQPAGKQTAANNPRLQRAYVALQALKRAITEDPKNLTRGWCGPDVCAYFGVFCAPAPDDPHALTVAGLDLNHGDLAGTFPEELGLLSDLALLHLNSNRFAGGLPESLPKLHLLHELDVSNNRLSGGFPQHILCLPNVKYVDLRFNNMCGPVPPAIFDKPLDALFLNDNHFDFELPENLGNSPASVVVLANLRLRGCIPQSVGRMAGTLNELVILNAGLRSCIPQEVGWLRELTVLDLSFNQLQGHLRAAQPPQLHLLVQLLLHGAAALPRHPPHRRPPELHRRPPRPAPRRPVPRLPPPPAAALRRARLLRPAALLGGQLLDRARRVGGRGRETAGAARPRRRGRDL
ncbi:hypothetical protein PVAP13_2NG054300 [Panicum virgatum]|uniref:Cell wall hydroxyproline-rich glycoprotein n=1 Tax=Panicum virgatum TaxID=38727 RepID=A0A8T0V6G4_PANVG|nr:hypothetical protein PVAP13_2NG054300 [Panicum virgatum]